MYKKIDFTKLEGLAVYQDTLDFLQTCYESTFAAIAKVLGDKVIISGVELNNGSYSEGWICLNGELLPFTGGLWQPKIIVEQLEDTELFGDDSTQTVYFTRRARLASDSNVDGVLIADFNRLSSLQIITQGVAALQDDLANLTNAFNNHTHSWDSITGKPIFARVATSGSYNDLKDTPAAMDQLIIGRGSYDVGDVSGDMVYSVAHNLNIQGNYAVLGSIDAMSTPAAFKNNADVTWCVYDLTANSFKFVMEEHQSDHVQNIRFKWILVKM